MGLKGDVGLGSRAERVAIIAIGVAMGSIGALPWMALAVALTSWVTVLQRILAVRSQLDEGYEKLKRGGDPPT
jgi:hypothetical protein